MFNFSKEKEEELFQAKQYIAKKIEKAEIESSRKYLAGASSEEIEEEKKIARQVGEKIAEERGVQYMFIHNISGALKNKGYKQELRKLVWEIDTELVSGQEMKELYEAIVKLLAKTKNRNELDSLEPSIRQELQPYLERPAAFRRDMERKKQLEKKLQQEKEKSDQRADAAEQRAEEWKRKYEELMAKQQTAATGSSSSSSSSSSHEHQMDIENEKPSNTLLSDFSRKSDLGRKRKSNGKDEGREEKAKTPSPGKSNPTR